MSSSKSKIEICEVGPRDGLQNLKRKFSVNERVKMINSLMSAGVTRIEAGSFVNPKKVPNMADFERLHNESLTQLPGVSRVNSSFAIRTVQKTTALPID